MNRTNGYEQGGRQSGMRRDVAKSRTRRAKNSIQIMLQKGVDNMITGQIIQTSIDELKAITKVDLGVYDLN